MTFALTLTREDLTRPRQVEIPPELESFDDERAPFAARDFEPSPHEKTSRYRFPPVHSFPPVHEMTRAELLALAVSGADSCSSELLCAASYVQALCRLTVELYHERLDAILMAEVADHDAAICRRVMAAVLERRTTSEELTL